MVSVARQEELRFVRLVDTRQATGVHLAGTNETQKVPVQRSSQGL